MTLDLNPVFCDLTPDERAELLSQAETRTVKAGDVLFYEGDPALDLIVLAAGRAAIYQGGEPCGEIKPGTLLDPAATLGGLPHRLKITVVEDGAILRWPLDRLWRSASFAAAARRTLATWLESTQDRIDELEAPIHYTNARGELIPGPFLFEDVTLIFAFCDADLAEVRTSLPSGVQLLRRLGRGRDSILLALAKFPNAHPESDPTARFAYTETTCFVPVRFRHSVGLYVPYIYPSAWEPILLGREIYGFPKRLGRTMFGSQTVSLAVDGAEHLTLSWAGMEAASEPRLVRALADWLGSAGYGAEAAFRTGEVLRKVMRLPPYRRIGVFNHKRILAPDATPDHAVYAVDCLTHAVFGVLRWYQIARMDDPVLEVSGGPLAEANLTLREAYRTQLDMRLSTGKVVRDYLAASR